MDGETGVELFNLLKFGVVLVGGKLFAAGHREQSHSAKDQAEKLWGFRLQSVLDSAYRSR